MAGASARREVYIIYLIGRSKEATTLLLRLRGGHSLRSRKFSRPESRDFVSLPRRPSFKKDRQSRRSVLLLLAHQLLQDLLQRGDEVLAVDGAAAEAEVEPVALVGALEGEDVRLAEGARLPATPAEVVATHPEAGDALEELDHLLLRPRFEDLEKDRLRVDPQRLHRIAHPGRHLQQVEALGDDDAGLADGVGDLLVGVAVTFAEDPIPLGLLERRQVLALEVLDEGDLERLLVGDVELDDRHLEETGSQGRMVPALAGDDQMALVAFAAGVLADEQRLQQTLVADRRDEVVEVAHRRTRLGRVGLDLRQRDHLPDRGLVARRELVDEVMAVAHLDLLRQTLAAGCGLRHG